LTPDTADAVIARQRDYFAARGAPLEWKYYDYDQPADLPARLVAAGFVPDEREVMLVAETAAIQAEVVLPDAVRLVPVTDATGVEAMLAVRELAFGESSDDFGDRLLGQLNDAPEQVQMVVAMAGDEPVSAARIEFVEGTDFAGLWGGGTVPAWRGRGIFRALVAYRAGLAAARGYRYLQVDALPTSRPILQRLGFEPVASTTPYLWRPERSR
jgi:GNAT superfamily N-acetyltransferase